MTQEECQALVPGDLVAVEEEGTYVVISNDTPGGKIGVATKETFAGNISYEGLAKAVKLIGTSDTTVGGGDEQPVDDGLHVLKTGDEMTGPLVVKASAEQYVKAFPDYVLLVNTGGIVMQNASGQRITLTIDDATGDLMVYNTDREKGINLTNGFADGVATGRRD